MRLVNATENKTVLVTLEGAFLKVRYFEGDCEVTGWNCDYEYEGFPNPVEYAAEAFAYEVSRYEATGYAKV